MTYVLVLFVSRSGHVAKLARAIGDGIERAGIEAKLRVAPPVRPINEPIETVKDVVDKNGYLFVSHQDLANCDGLAMGSPARFGTPAAPLKSFLETTSDIWVSGTLIDKPAGVFTSASSLHGGQEGVLQGLMMPLLHHGMVIMGLPYSEPGLASKTGGGTPYGPSHHDADELKPHEEKLAESLGKRLAKWVIKSAQNN